MKISFYNFIICNFKWSSVQRSRIPIHNSTLETLFLINNVELSFFKKWIISCSKNAQVTFVDNPQLNLICFQSLKQWFLIHTWSDKGIKGTVVNRAMPSMHRGSLEITLTVPLKIKVNLVYKNSHCTYIFLVSFSRLNTWYL